MTRSQVWILVGMDALFIMGILGFKFHQRRHRDGCLHDMHNLSSPWVFQGVIRGRPSRLVWNRNGVPWNAAGLAPPLANHKCRPQTCEITIELMHTDRCACGATRFGAGPWEGKGTREWKSLAFSPGSSPGQASFSAAYYS